MAGGNSPQQAIAAGESLALRVLAERLEHGQAVAAPGALIAA
jgi:hypothetical protein